MLQNDAQYFNTYEYTITQELTSSVVNNMNMKQLTAKKKLLGDLNNCVVIE